MVNMPFSISGYGVSLMDVSVSAVTNTVAYDALGRAISHTDGRGNTRHTEYNALGQRSASIDALGNRTSYAYDQFGNHASVTDPLGNAIVYEYDLRGRKIYEGGATYPVRYTYDIFGNKVTMMTYRNESLGPDSGDVTTWLYDEASGAMTNKVYADGKGPTYSYTPDGKLSQRTWARGITTDYSYDAWGSFANTVYSDGTPTISLSYDALGRQIEAHDAAGATTFVYDDFGSLVNETVVGVAGTNTIERLYDAFGRDAGYALNGTRQSTLAYDPSTGRLATVLAAGSETPFTWSYLPGSDLKSSLSYPNGLSASWTYDAKGQLLQVCNAFPTNVISQYDYTYDSAGRRVACGKSGSAFAQNDTLSYGYNEKSELTNAVAAIDADYRYSYAFDDIGNRETSSERGTNSVYTANNLNQYTSVNDFTPKFDDDGNQTLVKTATGVWQVSYNGENRPILWENISTNPPTPNFSTPPLITMSFDRMGRRITKDDQRFVYDVYLQIADNVGNAYIWDPTEKVATRPFVWNCGASAAYYVPDGNKNVSEVVFENGEVIAHYEYAPFGAVMAQSGHLAAENPWRFSGEYAEDDTATVYYNYRHFNPPEGRWCSRDMIGEGFAVNLMCYVRNRSACKFDFHGNKEQEWPRIGKSQWKPKKELNLFEYDVSIKGLKEGCEVNFIQLVRSNDSNDGGYWFLDNAKRGQGDEPDDKPILPEDMYYYDTFDPRQQVHYHRDGTVTFTDKPGTYGLEFYLFVVQRCCLEYYGGRKSCHCCKHSKATVVKRVHWETTSERDEKYGSTVRVTKLSKTDEYKIDRLLMKLLKKGGQQRNCEAYKRDNPTDPVMRTTIDLEFRYNSHD